MPVMEDAVKVVSKVLGGCAEGDGGCAALDFSLSSFSFLKAL